MKPERDRKYLAWIRTLPCTVCRRSGSEAHHTGPHGMGQKASDYTAIPLCTDHHTMGPKAYHRIGRKDFELAHRVNIAETVENLTCALWRDELD